MKKKKIKEKSLIRDFEKINIIIRFFRFLKENNVFSLYKKGLLTHRNTSFLDDFFNSSHSYNYIMNAFCWGDYPIKQGEKEWCDLHDKWEQMCSFNKWN